MLIAGENLPWAKWGVKEEANGGNNSPRGWGISSLSSGAALFQKRRVGGHEPGVERPTGAIPPGGPPQEAAPRQGCRNRFAASQTFHDPFGGGSYFMAPSGGITPFNPRLISGIPSGMQGKTERPGPSGRRKREKRPRGGGSGQKETPPLPTRRDCRRAPGRRFGPAGQLVELDDEFGGWPWAEIGKKGVGRRWGGQIYQKTSVFGHLASPIDLMGHPTGPLGDAAGSAGDSFWAGADSPRPGRNSFRLGADSSAAGVDTPRPGAVPPELWDIPHGLGEIPSRRGETPPEPG